MGVLRASRRVLLAALLAAAAGVSPASAAQETIETDVKAAFLFNFMKFVEWPTGSVPATDPFRLCVVDDDRLRAALERTIAGETVNGRPLQSVEPRTAEDARRCQLLYVGRAATQRSARLLSAVGNLPVLTVSDTADFARRGGGIQFVRENNRLRFDVNLEATERSGIKISSRLLRVARAVHESPRKR